MEHDKVTVTVQGGISIGRAGRSFLDSTRRFKAATYRRRWTIVTIWFKQVCRPRGSKGCIMFASCHGRESVQATKVNYVELHNAQWTAPKPHKTTSQALSSSGWCAELSPQPSESKNHTGRAERGFHCSANTISSTSLDSAATATSAAAKLSCSSG